MSYMASGMKYGRRTRQTEGARARQKVHASGGNKDTASCGK